MIKEKELWKDEQAKILQAAPEGPTVDLDISGQLNMRVSKSTLTQVKGSALDACFSGRHPLVEKDGRVFLDRNPKQFEMMITYLRNGRKLCCDTQSDR